MTEQVRLGELSFDDVDLPPLTLAPDAVHIDTTGVSIEQVVSRVIEIVTLRQRQLPSSGS